MGKSEGVPGSWQPGLVLAVETILGVNQHMGDLSLSHTCMTYIIFLLDTTITNGLSHYLGEDHQVHVIIPSVIHLERNVRISEVYMMHNVIENSDMITSHHPAHVKETPTITEEPCCRL